MKIIAVADRDFALECVRCLVSPYEHIWSDLPGLSLGKERVWFRVPSDGYENSKTWCHDWRCKNGREAIEILQTANIAPEDSYLRGWYCEKCDSTGSLRSIDISDGTRFEYPCEDCVDIPKAVAWAAIGKWQILKAEELARQLCVNLKPFLLKKPVVSVETKMPEKILWGVDMGEGDLFRDKIVDESFKKTSAAKPYGDLLELCVVVHKITHEAIVLSVKTKA